METEHLNMMGFAYYGKDSPRICSNCCKEWRKVYLEKLENNFEYNWKEVFEKWMKDNKVKVVFT